MSLSISGLSALTLFPVRCFFTLHASELQTYTAFTEEKEIHCKEETEMTPQEVSNVNHFLCNYKIKRREYVTVLLPFKICSYERKVDLPGEDRAE